MVRIRDIPAAQPRRIGPVICDHPHPALTTKHGNVSGPGGAARHQVRSHRPGLWHPQPHGRGQLARRDAAHRRNVRRRIRPGRRAAPQPRHRDQTPQCKALPRTAPHRTGSRRQDSRVAVFWTGANWSADGGGDQLGDRCAGTSGPGGGGGGECKGAAGEDPRVVVGWPGGIAPPGSHRTEREPLGSLRSSHRDPVGMDAQAQCANSPGSRSRIPVHHALNRLNGRSRLYFLPAHRIR